MRSNYNSTLERWTECVPQRSRVIVEASAVVSKDQKATYDDWSAADSTANLTVRTTDGSVVITGSLADLVSATTQDGYVTDLNHAAPYSVAQIVWGGAEPADFEIQNITAWLHPNQAGTGVEVTQWGCQVHALVRTERGRLTLTPLHSTIWTAESGSIAHEVTFDFSDVFPKPRPKTVVPNDPDGNYRYPTSYVFIFARDDNGDAVGSVGWGKNSANAEEDDSSNVMTGATLTAVTGQDTGLYSVVDTGEVPYLTIQSGSYAEQSIEFTTTPLDLGAAPTATVEFIAEGETPSGSSITYYVRNDADDDWIEYNDGDTTDDLAGVGKNQTYDIKATLTPDTGGDVSPILRVMGVAETTLRSLDQIATVTGYRSSVDPVTLKGEASTTQIVAIQDGRRDFADVISELLSENYIGNLQFRLWLGHPDLDRQYWMLLDTVIEPTYQAGPGSVVMDCTSVLALVKTLLPKYDTALHTRTPLTYAGETLKDTYDDLLDTQIALAGRFRGPGVEDDTTTISRRINEDTEAKDLLDAIAFLDGSAVVASQGLVKAVKFYDDKAIRAVFPSEEIEPLAVSPGFEHRLPQWTVRHDWSEDERRYTEERYYVHASALTNLGVARFNDIQTLDDMVAKCIYATALADTVGNRAVDYFGAGLVQLAFRSIYPKPHLEPGDMIGIETDRFLACDPNTANAVKGKLWILAVIVECGDIYGRTFTVWMREYADIFSTATAGAITVGLKRFACSVHHDSDQSLGLAGSEVVLAFDNESEDVGSMHNTSTNNSRITIPTGGDGRYSCKAQIKLGNDTYNPARGKSFSFKRTRGAATTYWGNLDYDASEVGVKTLAVDIDLQGGDYLQVIGGAPSGGSGDCDVLSNSVGDETRFWIARRGV